MLGKFVNMAELSRQMGVEDGVQGPGDGPLLKKGKAGVGVAAGGSKAGGGGKTGGKVETLRVVNLGDVPIAAAPAAFRSEGLLPGLRLEQRGELVRLAQPLLDQGLSVPEVQEALVEFTKGKQWATLSPATLEGIVESAFNALLDAEIEAEEGAQRGGRPVLEEDELAEVSLASVTPEPVRWLWPEKIPLGLVTVIYGEPGIGKTCLALDLAARVSSGKGFLDGTNGPEAGQVLIVNGEDPLADGICPRLVGGGANLQNIIAIAGMKASCPPSALETSQPGSHSGASQRAPQLAGGERSFDLGRDLPVLRRRIAALGQVRLLIIDPLEAYLGKGGSHRARLRSVMAELGRLAAETGVAVVVISSATKCDLPVKNVWRVDCDLLDASVRYWVPVRYNYGPLPTGLAFRVTAEGVAWETRSQGPTADHGRGASAKQERCVQLKEHADWLRQYLAAGASPARQVLKSAAAAGMSVSQLKRAKQALGVRCYKEPVANGHWIWDAGGEKVDRSE